MKKVLFVFGTRPEGIKLAPVIKAFHGSFKVRVCNTGQHKEMLDHVLEFFSIKPDYSLDIMKQDQTLFDVTAMSLKSLESVMDEFEPDLVIVQGDTTSAFTGALAAFYRNVKVAHVEAGLRSGRKDSPFPEEMNRILTGHIANIHFAPTESARANLLGEGVDNAVIHVTGNTVIDALLEGLEIIRPQDKKMYENFKFIDFSKRLILVTGHRRESFGRPFENICRALRTIAEREDAEIVYPVHLNPNVRKQVYPVLGNTGNIHLIEPLDYPSFIWLMSRSYFIVTDSGGIQEEAPALGKPVIVTRDVTERTEGIEAGTARLAGTETENIINEALRLFDPVEYTKMSKAVNPYGDGKSSARICNIIKSYLNA